MSRFTEHFDFDTTQYAYPSPSKSSFLSSYSSEELSIHQGHKHIYPLMANSYSSFDSHHTTLTKSSTTSSSSCSSRSNSVPCSPITPTTCEEADDYINRLHPSEEKALSSKLKRLLTTMSIKKKRTLPSTANLYASSTA